MAQDSWFWTTGATGDGATAYTQAKVILWQRQTFVGADNEGMLKDYLNELATTGATSPVATNTGGAYVHGFPYNNSASVDTAIPTPSSNTRIDRLVLRANWSAQTVRITRIAGTEGSGTPPAMTQTDGTTWDIPLYQVSITTGGAITLTDEREFLHPNIAVNTDMLDDDAVALAKMADNSVDSPQYVDGSIDKVHLAADIVDGTKIEDDAINSEHIATGAVDLDHMSVNSVDSDQYVDGSIDRVHLEADIIDGTKIEDDAVDSEHYVDGSIDTAHVGDSQITAAKIANRTRKFFVPATAAYNSTDTATIPPQRVDPSDDFGGFPLPDAKYCECFGHFHVPEYFVTGMTVTAMLIPAGTGNIRAQNSARYGACGAAASSHADSPAFGTEAVTADDRECVRSLSITSAATGDIVGMHFIRDGNNELDTIGDEVSFFGWIVEYTADS